MSEERERENLRIRESPEGRSYRQIAEHMKRYQELRRTALKNLEKVKHIIIITSTKGGVGKSIVTTNVAAGLALKGARVGVFDIDFHGPSVHKLLG
ncbi:MAG: P-loop NTPase, partial [Acidilobaceae archaeon]